MVPEAFIHDRTAAKDGADAVRSVIAAGDELCSQGNYRAAIRHWQTFLDGNERVSEADRKRIHERIADAYYQRSLLSLRGKATRKALARGMERLSQALQWNPESAVCLYEMGRCYLRTGDLERAAEWLERAVRTGTSTPDMRYTLAEVKLRHGDAEGALRLIEGAAEGRHLQANGLPGRPGAWIRLRAVALAAAGRPEEALGLIVSRPEGIAPEVWIGDVHSFATAARPSEGVSAILERIEETLRRSGDDTGALSRIRRLHGDIFAALRRDEKAVAKWLEAAEGDGKSHSGKAPDAAKVVAACERLALRAASEGDLDGAIGWCRRAIAACGPEPVLTEWQARFLLQKGETLWREGAKERARQAFQESAELHPTMEAHSNLAVASEQSGDWAGAATAWAEALKRAAPGDERASAITRRRVRALLKIGQRKEAAEALRRLVQSQQEPESLTALGYLMISAGEFGAAADAFDRAAASGSQDPVALFGLAMAVDLHENALPRKVDVWRRAVHATGDPEAKERLREHTIELGMSLWQTQDLERAMSVFSDLLLEDPSDIDGWIWCGILHLQHGRDDMARDCFDEAIRIDPNAAETLVKVGGAYLMSTKDEKATEFFLRAARTAPTPRTQLRIAEVCVEVDRPDLALEHIREGIELSRGSDPDLYRMLRLLVEIADDDQTMRSLLERAKGVAEETAPVRLMMAVQHLRAAEWAKARECLNEIAREAKRARDAELQEDAAYFQRTLILLMTVGRVDSDEFRARIAAAVDRSVRRHEGERVDPEPKERWMRRADEWIGSWLEEGGEPVTISQVSVDLTRPRLEVPVPAFEQRLQVHALLQEAPAVV